MNNEDKGRQAPKRDRYWSVMLVGDHGRIIPFRHFKALAIGICSGLVISVIALLVLIVLYINKGHELDKMAALLQDTKLQNSKLRDEKDLYLTKLKLKQLSSSSNAEQSKPSSAPNPGKKIKTPPPVPAKPVKAPIPEKPTPSVVKGEKKTPPPKKEPKIDWKADIRRISVNYVPRQEVLKLQFRIYNVSKPKKPLSGRTVVVFKKGDESPIKWISVPRVQLKEGVPLGGRGQAFRINNYKTMKFRAYRQKAPVLYNTATIYIFTPEGRLLATKDYAFKIDYKPPEPKKPVNPKPVVPKEQQPVVPKEVPKPEPAKVKEAPQQVKKPASEAVDNTPKDNLLPTVPANSDNPPTRKVEEPESQQNAVDATEPTDKKSVPDGNTDKETTPQAPQNDTTPIESTSPPVTVPTPKSEGEQP